MTPDLAARLAAAIVAAAGRGPIVVGLTGPQGSGKSTLAAQLPRPLAAAGLRAAVLGLDDLYLPKAERLRLAADVHPLLATRGVPGTHDVPLGLAVLESLATARATAVPSFDKGVDDRRPLGEWPIVAGPVDVVVFEGWCVGARPQPPAALATPVNELERARDPAGVWRAYANAALAGPYRALFGKVGWQALLRAPGFEVVLGWRLQQERELRAKAPGKGQSDADIAAFIQHYERLTRWIDAEMPGRAQLVARLGRSRELAQLVLDGEAPASDGPSDRGS